jgi:TRAP-type C4-dicarboxylate transport system permease small subunit
MAPREGQGVDEAPAASSIPQSWLDRIVWAGGVVSALVILYILGLTAIAVVWRYVLVRPISGVDEQVGFLVVASVMAGAAEALRRNDHISVDLITNIAPKPLQRALAAFGYATVTLFSLVLLIAAWRTVSFSYAFQAYSPGDLQIPMWLPQSTMLLGALLLMLVSIAKFVATVAGRPQ